MTTYRLRLGNGRVIGPFLLNQLHELKSKGHITGKEEAQVFPTGSWAPIVSFDFYQELMIENKTEVLSIPKEDTFFIDLTQFRNNKNKKEIDAAEIGLHVPTEELTSTMQMSSSRLDIELDNKKDTEDLKEIEQVTGEGKTEVTETDAGNKTIINPVAQQEIEKLRRLQKAEKEKRLEEEEKFRIAEAQRQIEEEEQKSIVPVDESTQMIQLDSFKNELLVQAGKEDIKIVKEEKEFRKKRRQQERESESESESEEEEDEKEIGNKKKKKLIVFMAVALVLYVNLFPEDEKPKNAAFVALAPDIQFPIPFDKADKKKSEVEFNTGKTNFSDGSYSSLVKAGIHFKKSYENDLENIQALNMMVRVYAEEVKHTQNKSEDTQTIFNIIQSKRPFLLQNPNGVIGLSLFYSNIGKHEAAADTIAKYLKMKDKEITPDLFATYLNALMKTGKIDLAKQFYVPLEKTPEKSRYVLRSLIDYSLLNQDAETVHVLIDDGIKRFPSLAYFPLKKAELFIKEKQVSQVEPLLEIIKKLNFESNNSTYARYLETKGLMMAFKGEVKPATEILKKSLRIEDSNELRMKLADLQTTGGFALETDKLISESKAIRYLLESQDFFSKRNYEFALSAAIKAVDAYPGHIPAELFLAKIQMKLGLAEQALKTLIDLQKKYPDNKDINFALLEGYIDTYKFHAAANQISIISSSDLRQSPEYASLNAKLYIRKSDSLQAISWLKTAINADPLNDRDMFYLAEILTKRANFDAAKIYINKCIELDPTNPDYRIAYAKTVYETQDDLAAIGYLLGLETDFEQNPKIMSEIAIFYYRAGRIKDFQDYKKKIESLPTKDKSLYEFLIKAALLDENYNDVPKLVEQLLAIEPGDIESMMTAGRVLFENGKLAEAAVWFKRIQKKLSTYPKVQYYVAKIKFLAGEIDNPKDNLGEEKKDEDGKVVLGALNTILDDIKANGENDASLVLLAEIYIKQDKLLEAENMLKKAQKINPKSYDALVGLAELSTKRNNFDLALDLYKKAMREKNDDPSIHKKTGDVYRLLGQGALAMESYKVYLEMNPEASDKGQIESYIKMME